MKEQETTLEKANITRRINRALTEIYAHRDGLITVLEKYGHIPLSAYSKKVVGSREVGEKREYPQTESLAKAIHKEAAILEPLYGEGIYQVIKESLENNRIVSTGPHHGIFTHPFFTGDLVISTIGKLENPENESIIVVADASVPLKNFTYGAGFILTETLFDENSQSDIPVKLHLTPSHRDTTMVVAKPFTKKEVSDSRTQATALRDNGILSKEKASIIWRLLGEFSNNPQIMEAKSLSEQATYINALLYPWMFAPDLRDKLPKLVYVDSERVMTNTLLNLLREENPLFKSILFDRETRTQFVKMGEEVDVVRNTDLLFTTMDSGERAPMKLDESGEFLIYPNRTNRKRDIKTESFPLTRHNIMEGLQQGRVYPGASLIFAMLGHYDIDSTGGFNQSIGYLPKFYQMYAQQLDRWGMHEEGNKIRGLYPYRISTTLSPVFIKRDGKLQQAGLFDIMNGNTPDSDSGNASKGLTRENLAKMETLTVDQLVRVNIPTIYNMVVPEEKKEPDLTSLETEKIAKELGVADKIVILEEK